MVYTFFDKKASRSGTISEANYQLVNELHKLLKNLKKEKYIHYLKRIFGE